MQQDSELESRCVPTHPNTTHLMNGWQHTPTTRRVKIRVTQSAWDPKAVLYRAGEWNLSGVIAIEIMALMGIRDVTLVCFDALANDFAGPEGYAQCITTPPRRGRPDNIGPHRGNGRQIVARARELMQSLRTLHPHAPTVDFSKR